MQVKTIRVAVALTTIGAAILALAVWIFADSIFRKPGEANREGGAIEGIESLAEGVEIGPTGLAIPVAGITARQLVNSYTEHDGLDIMAPAGTPVVAIAPGLVENLSNSPEDDGITASIRSDDARWVFYYAHLEGYAQGLKEGRRVERGQIIGRVGSTGSASPRGPHLHFEMRRIGEEEPRSRGTAVNPYPLLTGRGG